MIILYQQNLFELILCKDHIWTHVYFAKCKAMRKMKAHLKLSMHIPNNQYLCKVVIKQFPDNKTLQHLDPKSIIELMDLKLPIHITQKPFQKLNCACSSSCYCCHCNIHSGKAKDYCSQIHF